MLDFRPDTGPEDLVESSDDLGPNLAVEVDESEDDDEDSDDDSDGDVADIGEEAGIAVEQEENPFFADSDSDVSDTEDEDEDDGAAGGAKEPVDEEDELIKALKAAREKKVRNSPPDIKTADMVTDISFHPEQELVALAGMAGELAVFRCVILVISSVSLFIVMTPR